MNEEGAGVDGEQNLVVGESLRVLLQAERVEAKIASAVNGAVTELEEEGDLKETNEPENLLLRAMSSFYGESLSA
jgi:hypothetical protein